MTVGCNDFSTQEGTTDIVDFLTVLMTFIKHEFDKGLYCGLFHGPPVPKLMTLRLIIYE